MNNEQTPSSSDTSAERVGSGAVNKLPTIIPDTPIVSIASGTMSESTTTTTATKTTPTPFPQEQLQTMMSAQHEAKPGNEAEADQDKDKDKSHQKQKVSVSDDRQEATKPTAKSTADASTAATNHIAGREPKKSTSPSNSHSTNLAASDTTDAASAGASEVEAGAGESAFSQVLRSELSRPKYGATAKGKTQDDQNVGKRQKKKKVSLSKYLILETIIIFKVQGLLETTFYTLAEEGILIWTL